MKKLSASEALFGFVAWLTSLETPVTFSGHHEAGTAAQLAGEFCKANNFAEPREFWHLNLVHPTSRPTPLAADSLKVEVNSQPKSLKLESPCSQSTGNASHSAASQ